MFLGFLKAVTDAKDRDAIEDFSLSVVAARGDKKAVDAVFSSYKG